MTRVPAPVLFAFAFLILWPAAQIATLLLFRVRVQELALRAVRFAGQQQVSGLHVPIWAKVVGGALLAFSFVIASHNQLNQLKTLIEKGLF